MNSDGDRAINMLAQAEVAAAAAAALSVASSPGAPPINLQFANDQQRQLALASIFKSLSSLAAGNQQVFGQKQQHQQVGLEASERARESPDQIGPLALTAQLKPTGLAVSRHLEPTATPQLASQQHQRINYCTICNKELCNKYFMKTHMLKMHGINLEMEQPAGASDEQQQTGDSKARKEESNDTGAEPQSCQEGLQSEQRASQPTSVLNGFAGNSMGGVVCDICNKELCSKYFLKVHKQNTHGIATDQLDASQSLMYPIAAQLAAAAAAAAAGSSSQSMFNSSAQIAPTIFGGSPTTILTSNVQTPSNSSRKAKRPRLSPKSHIGERASANLFQEPESTFCGPIAMSNPLSALMCLGALGGPSGLTPALVVDNILRNQHLMSKPTKMKDRNGVVSGSSVKEEYKPDAASSSSSNSTSGARYFSHYTEACPMCDRRFKSIKWLKTHMMNDHKQEIAAYMHMMMQYLHYSSRASNQQVASAMAAAAAAAAASHQFAQHTSGAQVQSGPHGLNQGQPNVFNSTPFSLKHSIAANMIPTHNQSYGCHLDGHPQLGLSQMAPQMSAQNIFNSRFQHQSDSTIGQLQQQNRHSQPSLAFCTLPADYVIHGRRDNIEFSGTDRTQGLGSPASDLSQSGSELNFDPSSLRPRSNYAPPEELQLELLRPESANSEIGSFSNEHENSTNNQRQPIEVTDSTSLPGA